MNNINKDTAKQRRPLPPRGRRIARSGDATNTTRGNITKHAAALADRLNESSTRSPVGTYGSGRKNGTFQEAGRNRDITRITHAMNRSGHLNTRQSTFIFRPIRPLLPSIRPIISRWSRSLTTGLIHRPLSKFSKVLTNVARCVNPSEEVQALHPGRQRENRACCQDDVDPAARAYIRQKPSCERTHKRRNRKQHYSNRARQAFYC